MAAHSKTHTLAQRKRLGGEGRTVLVKSNTLHIADLFRSVLGPVAIKGLDLQVSQLIF